jgi:methylenetetrahydrofolate--tRNA-(uracil-5-)-methyltransferase
MGLVAGINAYRLIKGKDLVIPPPETAIGSLVHYLQFSNPNIFNR